VRSLPPRLAAIAALIPPGESVADIGTDHAYLPIFLIQSRKSPKVIATEVNKSPFKNADIRIKDLGLENKIDLRLGDGLKVLKPGEAAIVVLAGIGGNNIIDIFEKSPEVMRTIRRLVLNPATDFGKVRKWLMLNGWFIKDEDLVLEQGNFYQIIAAEKGERVQAGGYDPLALEIGPKIIEKKHPLLRKYLTKKLKEYNSIQKSLEISDRPEPRERLKYIKKLTNEIKKIYDYL